MITNAGGGHGTESAEYEDPYVTVKSALDRNVQFGIAGYVYILL